MKSQQQDKVYCSGGFIEKYCTEKAVETILSSSTLESLSDLAAVILSRSQCKRGNLDYAREILSSYLAKAGHSTLVEVELAKVEAVIRKKRH